MCWTYDERVLNRCWKHVESLLKTIPYRTNVLIMSMHYNHPWSREFMCRIMIEWMCFICHSQVLLSLFLLFDRLWCLKVHTEQRMICLVSKQWSDSIVFSLSFDCISDLKTLQQARRSRMQEYEYLWIHVTLSFLKDETKSNWIGCVVYTSSMLRTSFIVMCVLEDWLKMHCRSISFIWYIFLIFGIVTRRCWMYGCTISNIFLFTRYFSVHDNSPCGVLPCRRPARISCKNCCAVIVCIISHRHVIKSWSVLNVRIHESIQSDVRRYTCRRTIIDCLQSCFTFWTVRSDVCSILLLSLLSNSGVRFNIVCFVLLHLFWLQFKRSVSWHMRWCRVFTAVQVWLCTWYVKTFSRSITIAHWLHSVTARSRTARCRSARFFRFLTLQHSKDHKKNYQCDCKNEESEHHLEELKASWSHVFSDCIRSCLQVLDVFHCVSSHGEYVGR